MDTLWLSVSFLSSSFGRAFDFSMIGEGSQFKDLLAFLVFVALLPSRLDI
jgi:hypothetical protein